MKLANVINSYVTWQFKVEKFNKIYKKQKFNKTEYIL